MRSAPSPTATASNLRLLEGALTRVVALSSLTASVVTPEAVEQALPGETPSRPRVAGPDVEEIQEAVAARLDLSLEQLLSPSRTAPVARARQLAMYLTRELTELSLPDDRRGPSTAATTPPSCTPSSA